MGKILIVDDSHHIHVQLLAFLTVAGLKDLLFVNSAREAFSLLGLDKESKAEDIDLIMMDINLEDMDGIEATRRIKNDARYNDVPIIMVTGETNSQSLQAAFDAGAVDYITKPVVKIELLARVNSFLKLKKEIDARKAREQENEALIVELEEALSNIKTLKGFIPICATCKKVRDDKGYWNQIEAYIREHSGAEFSHGMCPDCAVKFDEKLEAYKKTHGKLIRKINNESE